MIQTNRSYSSIACTSNTNYSNPPPSSSSATMPPARGAKTLGWFMEADFLKGQQQQQQMNGGAGAQTTTYGAAAGAGVIRGGSSSDDSKSTTPSTNGTPSHHHHHYQPQQHRQTVSSTSSSSNPQQKKQKKYSKRVPTSSGAAARKEGFHAAGGQMSESSEDGLPTTTTTVIPPATSTAATATVPPPPPTVGANQEEYWFYDVASDGYYYEQNGAKGWRRRQPNAAVHKANGKEQEVAHMNVNGRGKYDQLLAAQAAAAHAAYIQHAIQLMSQNPGSSGAQNPQNPQNPPPHLNPPTMRYYDPNSDGFYYEMASVDGWKRRQPNKPASASLPHGMVSRPLPPPPGSMMMMAPPPPRGMFGSDGGSSYGAALARGQFPRNTVKHPEDPDPLLLHSGTETPGAPPSRDSAASSSSMSAGGDSCCFAELFGTGSTGSGSGSTSVPRPSSLNLEQKSVSPQIENTTPLDSSIGLLNAILADFNGGGKTYNNYASLNSILPPIPGMNSQQNSPMKGCGATTTTPGDSWNSFRSCSLFSPIKPSKRVLVPSATPLGSAPSSNQQPMGMMDQDGDDTLNMVMRDLDKLWTTTPVSGLNQA